MSLPSSTLTVPTLLNDQAYMNGVTLGQATPFQWTKLEGVAKAKKRTGDTSRPRARGSFVGLDLLDVRTITLTMDVGPPFGGYSNLAGALAALRTMTSTEGTSEYPLWFQLPNMPLLCCMARVDAWDPPYDVIADLGSLMKGVPMQFKCDDPYFYAAPTTTTTVGLPNPSGGFSFPIFGGSNLAFGGASSGNQATVVNSGDVPCYPMLTIAGPCLNPSVSNASVSGEPALYFDTQLYAGDQLVVDCDLQSVLLYPAGSSVGYAAPQVVGSGSTFFAVVPGSNDIFFNSQDTTVVAGTLTVAAASAYDGIL